jgi:SAM-dependent methyltransferase
MEMLEYRRKRILFFLLAFLALVYLKTDGYGYDYLMDYFRRSENLLAVPAQSQGTVEDDLEIVQRIVAAYQSVASRQENRGNSIWQVIFDHSHKDIHDVFLQGKVNEAANILRNPASTNLLYGFDNLAVSILPHYTTYPVQEKYAKICLDRLVRCAEAMGAIRLENPEAYYSQSTPYWKADDILLKIYTLLGKSLPFPNPFPLEHGVASSDGIISYRVPQAIYQAWRIKKLLKGLQNPRVLEIGAGLGRTALYARHLGIENYTIVDLPFTELASGYFLARTLGGENVLLSGEVALDASRRIKFLTPHEFLADNTSYDLIINADGFTEMDPEAAISYWKKIKRCASLFLSINHEVNPFTVKEVIDTSSRVDTVERTPYWMRTGYVEEVVRFKPK